MKNTVVFISSAFALAQAAVSPPSQFNGKQSGIGSWFQTNAESSSTNGNSWCGYKYSDDQPLFAPVRHPFAPRKPLDAYILCWDGIGLQLKDSTVPRSHGWRNILNIPYGLEPTETRILWPRSQSHQSRHWQIHALVHWRFVRSTSIRRRHRYRHRRIHRALWQRPQRQPQLSHEPCRLGAHWQRRSCLHPRWVNSPKRWLRKLGRYHRGRKYQPTK